MGDRVKMWKSFSTEAVGGGKRVERDRLERRKSKCLQLLVTLLMNDSIHYHQSDFIESSVSFIQEGEIIFIYVSPFKARKLSVLASD